MVFERRHIEEPTDAAGFVDRGNRYSRNGVLHKAIEDYTKAIELDPESDDAYYNRGCSWYEAGKNTESIADLTKAIELNPVADHYYGQRAIVYIFDDRPDLAQIDEDICQELRIKAQEG
jgi:tetratricopeptide (TPR) repeat protein